MSEIVLGSDDKLLWGSSGEEEDDKFTVLLEDNVGQSLVVGDPDEPVQVLVGESLRDDDGDSTVNEKHFGGVSVYYIDASHYLIAVHTKQIQPEKDKLETKLASNWTSSSIEVGIDAIKAETWQPRDVYRRKWRQHAVINSGKYSSDRSDFALECRFRNHRFDHAKSDHRRHARHGIGLL